MNNSTIIQDYEDFLEAYVKDWRLFVGVWELITFLIGAPSNALVAYLSCCLLRQGARAGTTLGGYRNHHLCVLSMAAADFLFAVGHCPVMFANYVLPADLDGCACRFMYFATHCSTVGSSLSLLWLNLDKFVCIRYPLRYYIVSSDQRAELLIIGGWLVSIAWSTLFIFGPLADGFDESCRVYVYEPNIYFVSFVVPFFISPIALSLVISLYVFVAASRARRFEYPYQHRIDPKYRRGRQYSAVELRRCRPSPPTSVSSSLCSTKLASPSTVAWKLRSVSFVFVTTVWSAATTLPFRTAFLAFATYQEPWLAKLAFALFAVMIANAVGNPFVTLLTQNQYRHRARTLLRRACGHEAKPEGACVIENGRRRPTVSSGVSESAFVRIRAMTL